MGTEVQILPPSTVRSSPPLTLGPTQTVEDVQLSETGTAPGSGEATHVAPPSVETNATGNEVPAAKPVAMQYAADAQPSALSQAFDGSCVAGIDQVEPPSSERTTRPGSPTMPGSPMATHSCEVGHETFDSGGSPLATPARCHGAARVADEKIEPVGEPNPVTKQRSRAGQAIAPCASAVGPEVTNVESGRTDQDDPLVVVDTETRPVVVDALLAFATSVQVPGPLQDTSWMAPGADGTFVDSHFDPPSTVHSTRLPVLPRPATAHRVVETHEIDVRPGPGDLKPSRRTENEAPPSVVLRIVVPGTPDGPSTLLSSTTAKQVDVDGQARPFGPVVVLARAGVVSDQFVPALCDRKKPLPAASQVVAVTHASASIWKC
jgi:hypothetical protein